MMPPLRTVGEFVERSFLTVPCFVAKKSSPDCFHVTSSLFAIVLEKNTRNERGDGLARLQFEQIGDGPALARGPCREFHAPARHKTGRVREGHEVSCVLGREQIAR